MRVVLDTSVLVAAARSRRGASSALLLRLLDKTLFRLFQYLSLLSMKPRSCIRRICWTEMLTVESFLDFLLSVSHLQDVFFAWRPALPDPDDDFILELAVATDCRYIVTHNVRDFRGSEKWGIVAITPSDFPQTS